MNQRKSGGPRGGSGKGANGGGPGMVMGDMVSCWLCSNPVSTRALFCHTCGTIQPPRVLDPFTRLGLPIRFDLDPAAVERQFAGFQRTLSPERFESKGPREKSNARAQLDAFRHAHDTLRDPIRRARHLLDIAHGAAARRAPLADPELDALEAELAAAGDTVELDRLANHATREMERCIHDLSAAFRANDFDTATRVVHRLERLEALAGAARERRPGLRGDAS
ncbi:hypothetical protein N825_16705 [Skermanella stibiiresistens SB22]|uniref:Molecular chaperone DnaJ n=1 Tax=Skermanella stibiiresistens SB22 TaxID=1385369 RepID=W9GZ19_9PROT|nr:hypothetical protein [Skermanella stibiiresistens]EWY37692.1 hypothetical protein N825_16705 [Skermanella stibiiresistens SB22]